MLGDGDVNGGSSGSACSAAHRAMLGPASGASTCARFAGLTLLLDGDPALRASWLRAAGGGASGEPGESPSVSLRCHLEPLPPDAAPESDRLEWDWQEPRGRVLTPLGQARVQREAGGFHAEVHVACEARAARFMLVGLTSMLLHLQGGLALHAASVVLDGGALAFIGPSGAGKSTTCNHVRGGEPFAVDRLVLLPAPAGSDSPWFAHPLPGGTPRPAELGSAARWLPLRSVLRVHPTYDGSRLEPCPLPLAVLLARESAFQLGRGPDAERTLLATLERLVRDIGLSRLHVQLGSDLTPLLRAQRGRVAQRQIT